MPNANEVKRRIKEATSKRELKKTLKILKKKEKEELEKLNDLDEDQRNEFLINSLKQHLDIAQTLIKELERDPPSIERDIELEKVKKLEALTMNNILKLGGKL